MGGFIFFWLGFYFVIGTVFGVELWRLLLPERPPPSRRGKPTIYEGPSVGTTPLLDTEDIFPRLWLNSSFIKMAGLFNVHELGSNATDYYTIQRMISFQCMIEALNQANFIPGKELVYDLIDIQNNANEALAAALKILRGQDTVMVVGPGQAAAAFPVASLLTFYNISVLSYNTGTELYDVSSLQGYARTNPTDDFLVDAALNLCLLFNWTLVTPIFSNNSEQYTSNSYVKLRAAKLGISFDCATTIPGFGDLDSNLTSTDLLTSTAECLEGSQSNVVLFFLTIDASGASASIINSIRTKNIYYLTATFALYSPNVYSTFDISEFGDNFVGTLGIVPPSSTTLMADIFSHCPTVSNPALNHFPPFLDYWEASFSCYLSQSRAPASMPNLPLCSSEVYKRSKSAISCICTGEEKPSQLKTDFRIGYVVDAVLAFAYALKRIVGNCSSIEFGNYCNQSSITGMDVFNVINAFPEPGVTGPLQFDGFNRHDPIMEILQILNVSTSNLTIISIGNYSTHTGFNIPNKSDIHFPGLLPGQIPISAIIPDDQTLSVPLAQVVFSICVFIIAISLFLIFLLFFYRDVPDVKRSSPTFCICILLGVILMMASLMTWSVTQTPFTCTLKVWLSVLGIGLVVGSLLTKSYRIYRIFRTKRVRITLITDKELLRMLAVLLLVDIVFLSIGTFIDGPRSPVVVYSPYNSLYSFTSCSDFYIDAATGLPYQDGLGSIDGAILFIVIIYNALLLLLSALFAYHVRAIDKRFSGIRELIIIIYTWSAISVIGLAVYFSFQDVNDSSTYQYLTRAICGILASIILIVVLFYSLLCIFCADMRRRWRGERIVSIRDTGGVQFATVGTGGRLYRVPSGTRTRSRKWILDDKVHTSEIEAMDESEIMEEDLGTQTLEFTDSQLTATLEDEEEQEARFISRNIWRKNTLGGSHAPWTMAPGGSSMSPWPSTIDEQTPIQGSTISISPHTTSQPHQE